MLRRQRFDNSILALVCVLILVNQQMIEPPRFLDSNVFVFLKQTLGQQQQVIKVDAPQQFQLTLVTLVGNGGQMLTVGITMSNCIAGDSSICISNC